MTDVNESKHNYHRITVNNNNNCDL